MKKISVVIPMYNEEEVAQVCYVRLTQVMRQISNYDYELIFINDGSKDKTLEIMKEIALKDNRIKILSFSRNFGHQSAVLCGLNYAGGDAVIIIDADLQDPPEVIPDMIKHWEEGFEVVYGKRKSRKGESAFKLLTASMFYRFINSLSNVELPKDTGDFRLVDRKVVDVIVNMPERNKYLRGLVSWIGFNQYPYEYDREKRYAGKTKYPLRKMMKLAGDGIISFSNKPLKMVGGFGIFAIIISIVVLIYSIVSLIVGNNVQPGWTSIMVAITFFAGTQLLCLWVIAEYISRIYDNSKARPEYIVDERINF